MNKFLLSLMFCFLVLVSCASQTKYPKTFELASDELNVDLNENYDVFVNAVNLFPKDAYYRVKESDYEGNDTSIKMIFDLGYTEIYSNASGDVFFNKFSEGIPFYGIVWLNDERGIVGIPDTKSKYLTEDKKWISYYDPVL